MTLAIDETGDIATCQAIRRVVFIEGQNVSEDLEIDGNDDKAIHILARLNGDPIGTARILAYGTTCKIGRVAVLAAHRGKGIGAAMIEACHDAARHQGATRVILGAQTHAIGFYEPLDYRAYGDIFDDAGIPHRMMEKAL